MSLDSRLAEIAEAWGIPLEELRSALVSSGGDSDDKADWLG